MSEAASPIHSDEWLLRRIFKGPGYFEEHKAPPIQRGAFNPSPSDTDGLSFYREKAITPLELVSNLDKPSTSYLVARLRAGDLLALGLTLVPSQGQDDLPGHVIVPEISTITYGDRNRRSWIKEVQKKLSDLASQNIAYGQ